MEVFLADLIQEQRRQGLDVHALVHGAPLPDDPVWLQRVPVQFSVVYAPIALGFRRALAQAIQRIQPDVLHLHMPNNSVFWALLLPAARRLPWVVHWPAVVPAGGETAQHGMTMDFSRTLLDAAGVAPDPAFEPDGMSLLAVWRDPSHSLRRPMHWRMNHRGQRALRVGDWKYLMVDDNEYLFNIPADERERANHAKREPHRLEDLRQQWLDWNATMPAIPADATVSLGFSVKDMPQR